MLYNTEMRFVYRFLPVYTHDETLLLPTDTDKNVGADYRLEG